MFEVGDSVIYYGHKGTGSKTIGVILDTSRDYIGSIEVYWFNGIQTTVRIEMIKKITTLKEMEKYVAF